jgi:hypothetical protein
LIVATTKIDELLSALDARGNGEALRYCDCDELIVDSERVPLPLTMAAFDNHKGTYLFRRSSSIVVSTQQLAIRCYGFAALAPRRNMISFHFV